MIAAAGLLLAATLSRDAALRPACDGTGATIATVPEGTHVEIRFALADGSNCYKIAATVDGKPVLGYVDGSVLAGTQTFDEQRRSAVSLDGPGASRAPLQSPAATYQSGDGGEKLYGLRVALRYDGGFLPADVARSMVAVLDDEFIRISDQLGCRAEERIIAIVQSREAYLKGTNAAEWSAGLYDGRIHVPLMDGKQFGPMTRRTFAHETVHACLANLGRFPTWLHEGLAQKLSGDTLSAAARRELQDQIRAGAAPKLENLGEDWSRLTAEQARLAYNLSLAAADVLLDDYANYGLRNVIRNPQLLEQVTAGIDKALGL